MTGPVHVSQLLAEWVDSLNPEAEIRYRMALCREHYGRGVGDGYGLGYVAAIEDVKAAQHGIYEVLRHCHEVGTARWHVCCGRCRLHGHRTGCTACQQRTPDTMGQEHPDDYTGGRVAWESHSAPTTTMTATAPTR